MHSTPDAAVPLALEVPQPSEPDRPIKRVVIVGGPCGGKSTVMEYLKEYYGSAAQFVPEAATILFSGGFPVVDRHDPYFGEWQRHFQRVVTPLQFSLEALVRARSYQSGTHLEIADRGIWDGAIYMPGGAQEFSQTFQLDRDQVYNRYDAVIHLQSLAMAFPSAYDAQRHSNPGRSENLHQAIVVEWKTVEAWSAHPNWHQVEGDNLAHKQQRVVEIINQLNG